MHLPRRSLMIGIAALLIAAALFALKIDGDMVDFNVNYAAGDRLLHGETLYRLSDQHYQFKYEPFCAVIYAPLALLPPTAARAVWYVLVLAAVAALFFLTARLLPTAAGKSGGKVALLAGLVLAKFLLREIQLGQINAIITALLMLMVFNLERDEAKRSPGRTAAAGLLWALAMAMKPYAVIFLPYFVLRRRWNVLWPALTAFGLTLLVPAAYYGFQGNLVVHEEWIVSLSASTPALFSAQDNVSLLAMLTKWIHSPGLAQFIYILLIPALALVVYFYIRRGQKIGFRASIPENFLLLLLIPLISPLGWDYTFLTALPAVALVLQHYGDFPKCVRVALVLNLAFIALSLYDLLGRHAYAVFMNASVLTLNFLFIAGLMVYLRWIRKA
ncbi:MAG: glycosyltransferase family 87 protein [Candidatus Aminicenantales bacterium]